MVLYNTVIGRELESERLDCPEAGTEEVRVRRGRRKEGREIEEDGSMKVDRRERGRNV